MIVENLGGFNNGFVLVILIFAFGKALINGKTFLYR